ncbi:MAG: DUF481 domain-containing protein [Blastomonas sp.]
MHYLLPGAVPLALLSVSPAIAAQAQPVSRDLQSMIDTALAEGDETEIETVFKFAIKAHPEQADALKAQQESHRTALAAKKAEAEKIALAEAGKNGAAAKKEKNGFFDKWSGEGQLGGSFASGNSDTIGASAALTLQRDGAKWEQNVAAQFDFQRSNGATTTENLRITLEPHYKFSKRLFAYGLAQYERDRFQGFSARYGASGGLGYRVIDSEKLVMNVKAGPAWRMTEFVGGRTDNYLAGLASMDLSWTIADNLTLSQNASAISDQSNTSVNATTALSAKVTGDLSARLSYSVNYESNPPGNLKSFDTISRATLVYGF